MQCPLLLQGTHTHVRFALNDRAPLSRQEPLVLHVQKFRALGRGRVPRTCLDASPTRVDDNRLLLHNGNY